MSSLYKLNGILKIGWLWAICHIGNEKGTGAEMYPTILSGSAPVSYWPVFSSIPSNSPRSHCEIQLSVVSFSYTAISRKVVVKNVHATIQKGSMEYDQFTVPDTVAVEPTFLLSSALANICPWPLVPFPQISLKNSELKTTHNTFRDCRVHFFRQPFSK